MEVFGRTRQMIFTRTLCDDGRVRLMYETSNINELSVQKPLDVTDFVNTGEQV